SPHAEAPTCSREYVGASEVVVSVVGGKPVQAFSTCRCAAVFRGAFGSEPAGTVSVQCGASLFPVLSLGALPTGHVARGRAVRLVRFVNKPRGQRSRLSRGHDDAVVRHGKADLARLRRLHEADNTPNPFRAEDSLRLVRDLHGFSLREKGHLYGPEVVRRNLNGFVSAEDHLTE